MNYDLINFVALPLNYITAPGIFKLSAYPVRGRINLDRIRSWWCRHGSFRNLKIFRTWSSGKFGYVRGSGVVPIDRNDPQKIVEKVRNVNADLGVDVTYEATGSEVNMRAFLSATKEDSSELLAIRMMANVKSDGSAGAEQTFNPISFAAANGERISFFSVKNHYWRRERNKFREHFENMLLMAVQNGYLRPAIGSLWQLNDAIEINEMLASGCGITGKLETLVDEDLWSRHAERQSGGC